MSTAFLFPGQGSQFVGMARDLSESFEEARLVLEEANDTLGFDLSAVMFGSGDEASDSQALRQTDVTQPALFVHSCAADAVLRARGQRPDAVAGHSLGEYSALAAAGAISPADGLRIVRLRGQLMKDAGTDRPGTMAAVLGLDDDVVDELCADASTENEVVIPANYNSPGQIVISGDVEAVSRAMGLAQAAGARRVLPLPVSGAFHSPLMEHARAGLAEALQNLTVTEPGCPVYLNVSAAPTSDADAIRSALLAQLTSPVLWSQTLANMKRDGVTRYLEVGAGKVLSGLVKRTNGRDAETAQAGTAGDFAQTA